MNFQEDALIFIKYILKKLKKENILEMSRLNVFILS